MLKKNGFVLSGRRKHSSLEKRERRTHYSLFTSFSVVDCRPIVDQRERIERHRERDRRDKREREREIER